MLSESLKEIFSGQKTYTLRDHNYKISPLKIQICFKDKCRDFPGGPVVKNPLSNAGDVGSIPGQRTKIPHATEQLSPHTTTIELAHLNKRAHVPQITEPTCSGAHTPQLEGENPHTTTREEPEHCNKETTCHN